MEARELGGLYIYLQVDSNPNYLGHRFRIIGRIKEDHGNLFRNVKRMNRRIVALLLQSILLKNISLQPTTISLKNVQKFYQDKSHIKLIFRYIQSCKLMYPHQLFFLLILFILCTTPRVMCYAFISYFHLFLFSMEKDITLSCTLKKFKQDERCLLHFIWFFTHRNFH